MSTYTLYRKDLNNWLCNNPLLHMVYSGLALMEGKPSPFYLKQKEALQHDMDKVLGTDGVLLYPPHPLLAPKHHHPIFTMYNFIYTGDTTWGIHWTRNHIHLSPYSWLKHCPLSGCRDLQCVGPTCYPVSFGAEWGGFAPRCAGSGRKAAGSSNTCCGSVSGENFWRLEKPKNHLRNWTMWS